MMETEKKAMKKLKKDGWKVLHKGCPDFLLYKTDKYGKISKVEFAEVKSFNIRNGESQKLTKSQKEWKKALEFLGFEYHIIQVDIDLKDSDKLMCRMCGKLFNYSGRGRPPKYCENCASEKKKKYDRFYRKKKRSFNHKGFEGYTKWWKKYEKSVETRKRLRLDIRKCPYCGKKDLHYDKEEDFVYCSECGNKIE